MYNDCWLPQYFVPVLISSLFTGKTRELKLRFIIDKKKIQRPKIWSVLLEKNICTFTISPCTQFTLARAPV